MQTNSLGLMPNPFLAWTSLVLSTSQMMLTSAQLIGQRLNRMLLNGDTQARNTRMMSEEKVAAAVVSAQTLTQGMFKLGQDLAVMAGTQLLSGVPLMLSISAGSRHAPGLERQASPARASLAHVAQPVPRIAPVARIAHKSVTPVHKAAAHRKRAAKHAANRH